MNLEAIQAALTEAGIDGWLFCDFHHRDPMAYRILGLDMSSMTTRRWFCLVPAKGQPIKLSHKVEPTKLSALPGEQRYYLRWTELHEELKRMVSGMSRVAMQYSPMNQIPYVSVVDAGTVELVRSFGPDVVTSAGLVQQFEAVLDDAGLASHRETGAIVQAVKDEAFAMMGDALRASRAVTEFEVKEFILRRFAEEGLTADGACPIVGFNDHPADPHFEPTEANAYTLKRGDTILVDLWARRIDPPGVYYDVTWCGFAGNAPPALYLEIFRTVCNARDAALDFVRGRLAAGEPCHGNEIDDVARRVVEQAGHGDAFVHRTGHNIGLEVHGNGVNIDNLETKDDRLVVPGICFSIEPGIYLEGKMAVRSEIDVIVTHAGDAEVAGPIQQDLILLD
ncbi:MAG: M24 family metallopeptidase [bacterium]|nr:M24 family metallopeptidase [bacterium]